MLALLIIVVAAGWTCQIPVWTEWRLAMTGGHGVYSGPWTMSAEEARLRVERAPPVIAPLADRAEMLVVSQDDPAFESIARRCPDVAY